MVYKATILENLTNGHEIITVKANDNDFGQFARIYYEIASEEMKQYFDIDRNTGLITSKITFDREHRDEYMIQLKATDGGSKFGFASIRVSIEDVNDNSPQFFVKEYKHVISTSNKVDEIIMTVNAVDKDINANGDMNFPLLFWEKFLRLTKINMMS
ncbi:hypothetical protein ACLKA7_005077 [Drosophila subpalustris]